MTKGIRQLITHLPKDLRINPYKDGVWNTTFKLQATRRVLDHFAEAQSPSAARELSPKDRTKLRERMLQTAARLIAMQETYARHRAQYPNARPAPTHDRIPELLTEITNLLKISDHQLRIECADELENLRREARL